MKHVDKKKMCSLINLKLSLFLSVSLSLSRWFRFDKRKPKPSCTVQCPCSVITQDKTFCRLISCLSQLFGGKTHVRRALTQSVSVSCCVFPNPGVQRFECLPCELVLAETCAGGVENLGGRNADQIRNQKNVSARRRSAALPPHSVEQTRSRYIPTAFVLNIRKDRWKCLRHFSLIYICMKSCVIVSLCLYIYIVSPAPPPPPHRIHIYHLLRVCGSTKNIEEMITPYSFYKRIGSSGTCVRVYALKMLFALVSRFRSRSLSVSLTLFSHSDTHNGCALFNLEWRSFSPDVVAFFSRGISPPPDKKFSSRHRAI